MKRTPAEINARLNELALEVATLLCEAIESAPALPLVATQPRKRRAGEVQRAEIYVSSITHSLGRLRALVERLHARPEEDRRVA